MSTNDNTANAAASAGATASPGPEGGGGRVVWKSRVDGGAHLEALARRNPYRRRVDATGRALAFLVDEWWLPRNAILAEVLAGLATGLSVLPEVVAFALVAGVTPERAIQTSMIMCAVATVLGGRPGLVTAAAGAVATISRKVVEDDGVGYLPYTVILMGLIQFAVFLVRGGRYALMIPHTVMLGFVNGLALIIAFAQVEAFKAETEIVTPACDVERVFEGGFRRSLLGRSLNSSGDVFTSGGWVGGEEAGWMLLEVAVCILAMTAHSFVPSGGKGAAGKARSALRAVPSSLIGILAAIVAENAIVRPAGGRTKSIGDIAQVRGTMPSPTWGGGDPALCDLPRVNGDLFSRIWQPALSMAMAGLLETVLTQTLVDDITGWRTSANREVGAQAVANVFSGCFGGMGGCAMIGQTMVNLQSGGFRRLSTFVAFVLFLLVNTAAYPAINVVPIASLVGVMWVVCFHTFSWPSLRILFASVQPASLRKKLPIDAGRLHKVRRADAIVIVLVTILTVFFDLFIAVAVGFIVAALCYSWESGQTLRLVARFYAPAAGPEACYGLPGQGPEDADAAHEDAVAKGLRRIYVVRGPLFFGSAVLFSDFFDPRHDPVDVEVHMGEAMLMDYSGIEALRAVGARYAEHGKMLHVRFLRPGCVRMASKAAGLVSGEGVSVEQLAHALDEGGYEGPLLGLGEDRPTGERRVSAIVVDGEGKARSVDLNDKDFSVEASARDAGDAVHPPGGESALTQGLEGFKG